MLHASFTRKDKMHSSKALLFYIYTLVQMCAALAAPNLAGLAHPTKAAKGLHVDTPVFRKSADGHFNRRQVLSRLFLPFTTKIDNRISLPRSGLHFIATAIAAAIFIGSLMTSSNLSM